MFKVFAFLTKKQDLDLQAFINHYENDHVPLIGRLAPPPLVYKRNYLVRGDAANREDDSIDFDVVTELVFVDGDAYQAWSQAVGTGPAGEQVRADEKRFLDPGRTRAYVIEERPAPG